ncbi:hypothetical protein BH23BAC1_BH23BAC1_01600 [soil metagenome]
MKTIDLIIILILFFGAFRGFVTGFLLELIGIIALFVALWSGVELMDWGVTVLSPIFQGYKNLLPYLSFFIIFIFVLIIIGITGRLLKGVLHLTILGVVDNIAGAILGIFKWAFFISLLFWLAFEIGFPATSDITNGSVVFPHIHSFAPEVVGFLSRNFHFIEDFFQSLKNFFRNN